MKFSLDQAKNVVISCEDGVVIITKYSPKFKAVIANFTYLNPRDMVKRIKSVFENSTQIFELLMKAGKITDYSENDKIESIAFWYGGLKHRIDRNFKDIEILNDLLKF